MFPALISFDHKIPQELSKQIVDGIVTNFHQENRIHKNLPTKESELQAFLDQPSVKEELKFESWLKQYQLQSLNINDIDLKAEIISDPNTRIKIRLSIKYEACIVIGEFQNEDFLIADFKHLEDYRKGQQIPVKQITKAEQDKIKITAYKLITFP